MMPGAPGLLGGGPISPEVEAEEGEVLASERSVSTDARGER